MRQRVIIYIIIKNLQRSGTTGYCHAAYFSKHKIRHPNTMFYIWFYLFIFLVIWTLDSKSG